MRGGTAGPGRALRRPSAYCLYCCEKAHGSLCMCCNHAALRSYTGAVQSAKRDGREGCPWWGVKARAPATGRRRVAALDTFAAFLSFQSMFRRCHHPASIARSRGFVAMLSRGRLGSSCCFREKKVFTRGQSLPHCFPKHVCQIPKSERARLTCSVPCAATNPLSMPLPLLAVPRRPARRASPAAEQAQVGRRGTRRGCRGG
mgnify:CR=1 FL=1